MRLVNLNGNFVTVAAGGRMWVGTRTAYEAAADTIPENTIVAITDDTENFPTFAGMIMPGATSTAPYGWLLCDGSAVSRTTYAKLFDAIGTNYGIGDGSTTFNLPDFRESTLVGAGQNTTKTIAAHDVYTVGQFKDDQFAAHRHDITIGSSSGVTYYIGGAAGGVYTTIPTANAGTATTTHGKQTGVNFFIKY